MTTKYYIHRVHSHCAWAGEHQSATQTYITNSETTSFVSKDDDIHVDTAPVVEIADEDVATMLKYFEVLEIEDEGDTFEINGLDLDEEYSVDDLW